MTKLEKVLERNVVKILPSKEALWDLMKKRKIRLYFGCDPTSPKLHLGHAIILRKLKEFCELGHEVILVFGTFTARIGDPSGRDKKREPLSKKEIEENIATYKEQVSKIMDLSKVKIKNNDQWLSKITFEDFIKISSFFTVSQLLERDMFQKRITKGEEIWINELLYPLMQGYDSVFLNVDLEVGGTDQTFNMLIGRKLQKAYHDKEKFILTTPLLIGADGRKMSKSYNNTINLDDSPKEMYGKIMSIKDNLITHYFELCTNIKLKEIKKIEKQLKKEEVNPKDLKAKLAREVVSLYHNKKEAKKAEKEFERVFKKGKMPKSIPEISLKKINLKEGQQIALLELLTKIGLTSSKSEAKRLIKQKGVKIDKETQKDWKKKIKVKKGMVLQKGKRKFVKLV